MTDNEETEYVRASEVVKDELLDATENDPMKAAIMVMNNDIFCE